MNNTDDIADGERLPKEPNGLERFADALQVATMDDTVDPEERKQIGNILDNVVDSATDKPVDPDDFKHLDLVNPSLRDDLGEIFAYHRSEEHTSEIPSLMRISYAVISLNKKKNIITIIQKKKTQTITKLHTTTRH